MGLFNFGNMNQVDPMGASLGLMQLAQAFNNRPRISTNPADVSGPDDSMRNTLGLMQYQQQAQRQKMLQDQMARQARLDDLRMTKEQGVEDRRRKLADLVRQGRGSSDPEVMALLAEDNPTAALATKKPNLMSVGPGNVVFDQDTKTPIYAAPEKPQAQPEYLRIMQAAGIDPNSPQGKQMLAGYLDRKGQSPQVNIDMKQPTAEATEVGKFFGKTYSDIQSGAMAAPGTVAKLNRLEAALAKSPQGWGADTIQEVRRIGETFGIKIGEGAGPGDVARSISNEMALQMRDPSGGAGMPGALSDADRKFLQMSTPGLAQTPEGNKMLIDYRRRLAKREQEVGKLAREYRQKKGTFDDGFLAELADWSAKNPLFTEEDQQRVQAASAPAPQAQPTAAPTAPRVVSPADYDRLPAGAIYIDPNGITRRKGSPASATVPLR